MFGKIQLRIVHAHAHYHPTVLLAYPVSFASERWVAIRSQLLLSLSDQRVQLGFDVWELVTDMVHQDLVPREREREKGDQTTDPAYSRYMHVVGLLSLQC